MSRARGHTVEHQRDRSLLQSNQSHVECGSPASNWVRHYVQRLSQYNWRLYAQCLEPGGERRDDYFVPEHWIDGINHLFLRDRSRRCNRHDATIEPG